MGAPSLSLLPRCLGKPQLLLVSSTTMLSSPSPISLPHMPSRTLAPSFYPHSLHPSPLFSANISGCRATWCPDAFPPSSPSPFTPTCPLSTPPSLRSRSPRSRSPSSSWPRLPGSSASSSSASSAPPTEQETQQLIAEVQGMLEAEHPELPLGVWGRDDAALISWFLKDRRMDAHAAATKIALAIKWRQEFGVANLTEADVAEEAATGKAYLHSFPDVQGRPVIIVQAAKHFPPSAAEGGRGSEKLCAFLIERALEGLPPGEDKILALFNLQGFSAKNADLSFIQSLINMFYNYYPKRLHKVLFVDAPPIFRPVWGVIKPMLKSYASLVEFCDAEGAAKYFAPGQAPDLE